MNKILPVDTYLTSREGYPFSLKSRIWKISREYPINLEWIDEILEATMKESFLKTLSPTQGPLSDLEFQALHEKLTEAFETKLINIEDFILAQIFITTGRRPAQIADLKIKDFIETQAKDGLREFFLNVPRGKQRGTKWRAQFKAFAISAEIGQLIKNFIQNNLSNLEDCLNFIEKPLYHELPLFPKWSAIKKCKGKQSPESIIRTPEIHYISAELRAWLDAIISNLEIPSERTGKHLRIFPTRLRRTLATRAAREGFGELIIAELLDHSDTQNAKIYTENVPEHVNAINKAIAQQIAPLAQAFSGMVVEKESSAKRGNDISSRVRSENGNLGTCGHYGFCGAIAPIACYTCRNFQPWLNGPHDEILDTLISERERILAITKDQTIASVNDRTILAVTQVIQICKKRREYLSVEKHHD